MRKKTHTRNMIVNCHDDKLALDHIPVSSTKLSDNASVILFQPVQKIQDAGNQIRKKLSESGFYAKYTFDHIIYHCQEMKRLVEMAQLYSRTASNIMLVGETGTGKELFAQSIHNAGTLSNGPFVAVNCAALPGNLLESELFGYAPGAFTGASRGGKIGLFELAHEGTLFLDELTEMDVFLQAKMLRALQTGEIMRIGDNKVIPINVRIIAATNKNPLEAIKAGRLRADLFYRLNVLDLKIPPCETGRGTLNCCLAVFWKRPAICRLFRCRPCLANCSGNCATIAGRAMCANWKIVPKNSQRYKACMNSICRFFHQRPIIWDGYQTRMPHPKASWRGPPLTT